MLDEQNESKILNNKTEKNNWTAVVKAEDTTDLLKSSIWSP